jgi:glycosyltransferase involved in cell wall biosynthesis
MAKLDCALSESELKAWDQPPLLSVVVLSYKRVAEMKLAVDSFTSQLVGGLENKVEIVISDNASGGDTLELIRTLAREHPGLSYVTHARDEGGFFNLFAAPWRARGRYTWVFGSDDLLLDGGLAGVVEALEAESPAFMTMNKRAAHADLSGLVWERANSIPNARFNGYADLFAAVGVNQLAFLSCQVEDTERARKLDAAPYLRTDTRHPHVAAYLEKHHDGICLYNAANDVVHRLNNSPILDYHAGNFFDYAVTLPALLWEVMGKVGAPKDLFERVTGHKRVASYDPPQVTFIDTMFENMLRAAHFSRYLTVSHHYIMDEILSHCRPHRREQFDQIWDMIQQVIEMERRSKQAQGEFDGVRARVLQASQTFVTADTA